MPWRASVKSTFRWLVFNLNNKKRKRAWITLINMLLNTLEKFETTNSMLMQSLFQTLLTLTLSLNESWHLFVFLSNKSQNKSQSTPPLLARSWQTQLPLLVYTSYYLKLRLKTCPKVWCSSAKVNMMITLTCRLQNHFSCVQLK